MCTDPYGQKSFPVEEAILFQIFPISILFNAQKRNSNKKKLINKIEFICKSSKNKINSTLLHIRMIKMPIKKEKVSQSKYIRSYMRLIKIY